MMGWKSRSSNQGTSGIIMIAVIAVAVASLPAPIEMKMKTSTASPCDSHGQDQLREQRTASR